MQKRALGSTGLAISSLVLGGNVFGWTIDERQSFAVLDAFVDHGFDAIDTADIYSAWAPGNKGGESETIIGNWLKARPGIRDKVVIFTKVGYHVDRGLSRGWIEKAVDASLARLGIERIDLYFSHEFDPKTPHEETLATYAKLLDAGKIAHIGASNFDATELADALAVAKVKGLPAYQVLEPEYNLYDRASYDGALRDLAVKEGLGVVTYYSLASGFLSGKYRSAADLGQSQRGAGVVKYLTPRGEAILKALDEVSARHAVKPAEVALAWLIARPGVTAPIASATRVTHVESFAKATAVKLNGEDIAALDAASD